MKNIEDIFGISRTQMQALVSAGLHSGGDWCDLYFEHTEYHELLLRDGSVNSGGHHVDYGCGIRVLYEEKTGYAYSETTDYPSLLSAAKAAGSIAISGGKSFNVPAAGAKPGDCRQKTEASKMGVGLRKTAPVSAGRQPDALYYGMKEDWRSCGADRFVPWLERLENEIRSRDSRVLKVIAMLSDSVSTVAMYNSLGELTSDTRPLGSVSVTVIFAQGEKTEQKNVSRSFRTGAELLTDSLLVQIASLATDGIDAMFEAKRPKGGKMPVVMGAGASGILLHEAMGHAFEADFNRKGQSIFSDKFGKRICRKGIDIIDDGTIPDSRGSINIDDEGIPGQKTYMVTDGVLTSYLHDRISAGWYGVPPTGNGRRESFRYNPIPRMRTTYMASGHDGTCEDLIASVKKGIFVNQFANGQVKIGEGDFTFYVKSGFLIENGRLTMPVKDINVIGNGPEALADIGAVASDLRIDESTWTCGKEQSVAVSCGIPSVLIKKLTVGGE